jgi:protein FAM50
VACEGVREHERTARLAQAAAASARRSHPALQVLKGDTVATFLEKCRLQFPELRAASVDNLMYIKVRACLSSSILRCALLNMALVCLQEDLIIPHHYTFYDFIINKSRGKSGPLFNFDVHDDVRLLADARVEKDEVGVVFSLLLPLHS